MGTALAAVDEIAVPQGANEELAGPQHVSAAPVVTAERVNSIDTLRGFALMGILIMNITSFGLSAGNYDIPLSTVKPVFDGPHWKLNTTVWFLRWVFAEGKARGLFSMLFGAGVVLLTERAEKRGAGVRVADIYTRRNMWLVVFGLLHAYLVWDGDILFFYGVAALMICFPFRVVRPRKLMWTAAVVLVLNSVLVDGGQTLMMVKAQKKAEAARKVFASTGHVTEEQRKAIDAGDRQQGNFRKSPKKRAEDIAGEQAGYWSAQGRNASDVLKGQTKGAYFGFGDWAGMMLLGMALYKNGFLANKLRTRVYVWTAVVGCGIAWPLIFFTCWEAWKSHFDMVRTYAWTFLPYGLGRVAGAVGGAALILLLLRSGVLPWAMRRVAAVGQMALSNYLLTSISMRFLFVWGPLKWYGYMEYYKLYLVVLCMWAVNLTWSSIWLHYFEFGPMEWVWRSLTYWKRQPMRIREKTAEASAAVLASA